MYHSDCHGWCVYLYCWYMCIYLVYFMRPRGGYCEKSSDFWSIKEYQMYMINMEPEKNHRANHHFQVLYGSFNWIMNQIFTNWKWLKNHHVHPFSKDWLASFQVLTEHKSLIWPTEAACYIFHMPPEWSEVWLIQGCGGMDGWSEASKNATTFSRARCRCYIVLGRFIYAILWYLPRGWRTFPLNDDGIHFGNLTYPIENGPFEDVFPIINGGYSSQLCQFAGG